MVQTPCPQEFSDKGGKVQVVQQAEAVVVVDTTAEAVVDTQISILNTGSEIQPEQQEKIFHKFYQADESHAAEGNGVGLAIVKKIVDLHGGQIQVSSEDDVTVFAVTLPKDN